MKNVFCRRRCILAPSDAQCFALVVGRHRFLKNSIAANVTVTRLARSCSLEEYQLTSLVSVAVSSRCSRIYRGIAGSNFGKAGCTRHPAMTWRSKT